MNDPLSAFPRSGDVFGSPIPGHKVERIWAAVCVYSDGSEGMVSHYTFKGEQPAGRITFATSDPKMLRLLKRTLAALDPPHGGRFEWREYVREQ